MSNVRLTSVVRFITAGMSDPSYKTQTLDFGLWTFDFGLWTFIVINAPIWEVSPGDSG